MPNYKTTSNEDRERIISSYLKGITASEIGKMLNIKESTIYNIIRVYSGTGRIQRGKCGGNRPKILNEEMKLAIKTLVDDDCTISLKSISEKISTQYGITVCKNTINRVLEGFNYSVKRVSLIPTRRNDEAAISARRTYALSYIDLLDKFGESDILFLDEFGCNISMRHTRGRSLTGSRAVCTVPALRSRNVSVCATMSVNGILKYQVENRAFNSDIFLKYMQNLCDTLKEKNMKGCVIVMDNVPFHKCKNIREFVELNGHMIMLLPPYSPFLNPIENLFSKWKGFLKSAQCSSEEDLLRAIHSGVEEISENDCSGFYRNMFKYISRCLKNEVITD